MIGAVLIVGGLGIAGVVMLAIAKAAAKDPEEYFHKKYGIVRVEEFLMHGNDVTGARIHVRDRDGTRIVRVPIRELEDL